MKLLIDCSCGADILKVEKVWEDIDKKEFSIWLCMYKGGQMSLWDRVKASWHYFWRGEFFFNDISFDEKDLERLISFLEKVKVSEVVKY